jgi:hypothetical protein
MFRRPVTVLSALSLVLFLAAVVLWARSYGIGIELTYCRAPAGCWLIMLRDSRVDLFRRVDWEVEKTAWLFDQRPTSHSTRYCDGPAARAFGFAYGTNEDAGPSYRGRRRTGSSPLHAGR